MTGAEQQHVAVEVVDAAERERSPKPESSAWSPVTAAACGPIAAKETCGCALRSAPGSARTSSTTAPSAADRRERRVVRRHLGADHGPPAPPGRAGAASPRGPSCRRCALGRRASRRARARRAAPRRPPARRRRPSRARRPSCARASRCPAGRRGRAGRPRSARASPVLASPRCSAPRRSSAARSGCASSLIRRGVWCAACAGAGRRSRGWWRCCSRPLPRAPRSSARRSTSARATGAARAWRWIPPARPTSRGRSPRT